MDDYNIFDVTEISTGNSSSSTAKAVVNGDLGNGSIMIPSNRSSQKLMDTRIKKISPKTNCPVSPGGTSPSPVRKRGQERCICTYNRGKLPRPRCEKGGTAGETYPSPVSKTVYFTYTRGNFPASCLKNGAKTVYCTYLGASIAPTAVEI